MPTPAFTFRALALGTAGAALALGLTAAPALTLTPAAGAAAAVADCVPGYGAYPNLNASPSTGTDSGVSFYAGGDFRTLAGASEGEGTFVVGGDATFGGSYFNLGVVGSGSRITPPAGSDMLTTGGDVTVSSGFLEVGNAIGGDIVSGGVVSPLASVGTNGGTISQNVTAPLTPYASTVARYTALSADAASTPVTGTVAATGWDVTFTGDNSSAVQVFSVGGSQLGAIGATKTMVFDDIPVDAVVIVNVTGTTAVLSANTFQVNGSSIVPDSTSSQAFTRFTQSLLWNFPGATAVTLGDGDQLLGSILVPQATSTLSLLTSTNGRLYAGGDVTFGGGAQTGLELHNYSFRAPVDCVAATGTLSITKTLADADGVVDDARSYTGAYECRDSADAVTASGTWSLLAGGPAFTSPAIASGSTCSVSEDALTVAPSASDDSYRWNTPVVSPASVVIGSSATPVSVTVHNSVRRLVGDLAMRKILEDPDGVVDPARTFSGTFACDYLGSDITPRAHTWTTAAGQPAQTIASGLPAGATCSLTENDPSTGASGSLTEYSWAAPRFSAASVTIVAGDTAEIVVTNRLNHLSDTDNNTGDDDGDDSGDDTTTAGDAGSGLASTGLEVAGPLALGGGFLGLGVGLFFIARRRNLLKRS